MCEREDGKSKRLKWERRRERYISRVCERERKRSCVRERIGKAKD